MSRLTVCVVRVGKPNYEEFTRPFIEYYCDRHKYDLVWITTPPSDTRHPSWQKLLAREFYPDAGRLLVMDLDIMPLPWADPIHPYVDSNRITLSSIPLSGRCQYRMRRQGVATPWRFSNGLMGIPASEARFMREVYDTPGAERLPFAEMLALCRALQQRGEPPALLPAKFNVVITKRLPIVFRADAVHAFHFAGPDRYKRRLAEKAFYNYECMTR